MTKWAQNAGRLGLYVLTGFVLQAASPPSPAPWAIVFALAATTWAIADRAPRDWLVAGTTIGAVWFHVVARAVAAEWGVAAAVALYVWSALAPGFVFLAAGWISRSWDVRHRVFALVGVWPIATLLFDRVASTPLVLAPSWADTPHWLAVTRLVGAPGFDALILLMAGGLAFAARGAVGRGIAIAGASVGALLVAQLVGPPPATGALRVAGLQPNVATRDFGRAQWSLYERRRIETRLDAMTEAVIGEADLVVWPEGGNELANAALRRRVDRLAEMTASSSATVLTGSRNVDGRGRIANVASTWAGGSIQKTVVKANPVPFAESALEAGRPETVSVAGVEVGVSICFDALFSRHVRALVEEGAEILVATSDDASLADTRIAEWHSAHARMRAIEAGRSLVFVSNAGPTIGTDPAGRALDEGLPIGARGSIVVRAETVQERTPQHHLALPFALALFLVTALRRRQEAASHASLPVPIAIAGALVVIAAGRAGASVDDTPKPRDDLSPLFAQTAENTCGAAAVAFAMTYLGDEVFEADVLRALPPVREEGFALSELAELARSRGFAASGWEATTRDLEALGGGVAIARFEIGHFVAVLGVHADTVVLFDPSLGRTIQVPRGEFEAVYAGRVLFVTPGAPAPLYGLNIQKS